MPNFGELKRYLERNGWTLYRKIEAKEGQLVY